jgi:NAD(P)-dependent dehydrogenase (short-subunit alcohol dehydrogenase family)
MNIDLTGKTAIVTGSTTGIGFAIVVGLAQAGAAVVVVNGRERQPVDRAMVRLRFNATTSKRDLRRALAGHPKGKLRPRVARLPPLGDVGRVIAPRILRN